MDKLKEQLAIIQPHLFWILAGVALLVVLGGWYSSVGELDTQRESNSGSISQGFNQVNNIRTTHPLHPNDLTLEKLTERNRKFSESIAKGWQAQYSRQAQVLVWPAVFQKDFHDAVDRLRTIELLDFPTKFRDDLSQPHRQQYRDFIEDVLPDLAKAIGADWKATRSGVVDPSAGGRSGPGGFGPDAGAPGVAAPVDNSIVFWSPANQQEILTNHFGFTARAKDPATLEVLYAQEDLWIFDNITKIIARSNEGAKFRYDAAIKMIDFIRIGRSAFGDAGLVQATGGPLAAASPAEGAPPADGSQPPADGSAPAGDAPPEGLPPPIPGDPANWRYVDAAFKPLYGEQLRFAHRTPTPANALLLVAKRMPVRMRFQVDQRRLNSILAECGNAPLPLEVRQVRVNRSAAAVGNPEAAGAGAGAGAGPGVQEGPGGYQGGGEGGFGGQRPPTTRGQGEGFGQLPGGPGGPGVRGMGSGSTTSDATVDTHLIDVEIYGIVYIYNPVNLKVLGLEPPAGAAAALSTGLTR